MIFLTLPVFFTGLVFAGFFLVFGLWFFYDRRDRSLYDRERDQHAYHCTRCGALYSGHSPDGMATCPQCEFRNVRLRF